MFKCQDRESEGSEVTVKKRREGEEREEKVNKVKSDLLKFPSVAT